LLGTRVLLAEDNVVNQTLAVHLLKSLGCHVDVARDGNEAVMMATTAESAPYDVILMDCHMPELDGYRAATAIRDRMTGKAPPILALTAAGSADDVQKARDAGMEALLQKPMDADGIRAHLGRVVSKAAMR
jgi:two-component system sensor histidine kinase/response regulator